MPYHIGAKGSNGCSGYPVLSDTGHVAGCHSTEAEATAQLGALYANVADASKSETPMDVAYNAVVTDPTPANPSSSINPAAGMRKPQYMMNFGRQIGGGIHDKNVVEIWSVKSDCTTKADPCWDGYVQRGMKPGDNGSMVPNCVPAEKADDLWEDDDTVVYETDTVSKADGYSPPAGARSAARRAIKFKEDGKANGAGTAVGWTRAGQLARGETISLSTVKRMYSYFSRHEVDKKGKDWGNTANPSNGYIMWLAWGGDAGYSWSRRIVEAEKNKSLFANFGKDYSKPQFKDVASENPIMPTQTYEGCECDYCAENELTCSQCPECGGMDAETEMAAYDASLGKSDEVPVEPTPEPQKPESFFNFRDMRPTRNTVRLGE